MTNDEIKDIKKEANKRLDRMIRKYGWQEVTLTCDYVYDEWQIFISREDYLPHGRCVLDTCEAMDLIAELEEAIAIAEDLQRVIDAGVPVLDVLA